MRSPYRQVIIPANYPGRLFLCSMPGYHQPVETFTNAWPALTSEATDIFVVCLAEASERHRKSPTYEAFLEATGLGDRWVEFPIGDYSAPEVSPEFLALLDRILEIIATPGGLAVIHCAAGVGRTGTVAASVLVRMGVTYRDAAAIVREAGSGPETPSQKEVARSILLRLGQRATDGRD
jgi:protein-tyrosine phosphatase